MDGDSEKDHKVVDNCLNAFETPVLRCSKEVAPIASAMPKTTSKLRLLVR